KVDWPYAPPTKYGQQRDQFGANFTYAQQQEVLDRAISVAKALKTDRIRCFDFWRLDDQAPYRQGMNEDLRKAAEKLEKIGMILILENESSCNTATGAEAAKVLAEVKTPSLMLNWDPGNAADHGETPFPNGYSLLPKERIGHCHC